MCVCILFTCMCMYVCVCIYMCVCACVCVYIGFWSGSVVKTLPANAGDTRAIGSIPGLGKSKGRNGILFRYSCLENPMDRGVWRVIVHGVAESTTWLSNWAHTHIHTRTHVTPWIQTVQGIILFEELWVCVSMCALSHSVVSDSSQPHRP